MKITTNYDISGKTIIKTFCKLLNGNILDGKNIEKFENHFKEFIGVKHAIATSSGRYALYITLKSLKINKGIDEIIIPSYMPALVGKIVEISGLKPVFADIDPTTLNIDPNEIEKKITKNTKVILVVHLHGIPCDMKRIVKIAKRYNLFLIEDCAQSLGSYYQGKKTGTFGFAGIFSFNLYKNLTTFGGGMVVTNDDLLNKRIRENVNRRPYPKKSNVKKNFLMHSLKWLVLTPIIFSAFVYPILKILFKKHSYDCDYICKIFYPKTSLKLLENMNEKDFVRIYGQRFTNLHAFIGLEQLKNYSESNKFQNINYKLYSTFLSDPLIIPKDISPKFFLYFSIVDDSKKIWIKLFESGILSPVNKYENLPDLKMFNSYSTNCPVARKIVKKVIYLPLRIKLKEKQILKISQILNKQNNIIKNKHISLTNPTIIKNMSDDVI